MQTQLRSWVSFVPNFLVSNYQALDAVFDGDCPICAANLKTMWCEYACNPLKANFLTPTGVTTNSAGQLFQEVIFNIDSDYSCEIFQSCEQVSFIAQSDVTSSLAFLDFLGVNGQNQSLSIITFNLTTDAADISLEGTATGCGETTNGTVNGYTADTCGCSYCQAACEAPAVDDTIGFLDGLSWKLVGYSYLGFFLFTLIYQVSLCFCCKRKPLSEMSGVYDSKDIGKPVNYTD